MFASLTDDFVLRLDTNIYIANFRSGAYQKLIDAPSDYLSTIVLSELYIGATQSQKRKIRSSIEKRYAKKNRIVVPIRSDYNALSEILQPLKGKLDINQRGIAFDVLIALTSRRVKATLVTEDVHFEIIKSVMRRYRDFRLSIADRSSNTLRPIP